jgi:hypothetical protein
MIKKNGLVALLTTYLVAAWQVGFGLLAVWLVYEAVTHPRPPCVSSPGQTALCGR